MSIRVKCPKCFGEIRAKDALAGQRVRCPKCGQPLQVPDSAKEPAAPAEPAVPAPPQPPAEEVPAEPAPESPVASEPASSPPIINEPVVAAGQAAPPVSPTPVAAIPVAPVSPAFAAPPRMFPQGQAAAPMQPAAAFPSAFPSPPLPVATASVQAAPDVKIGAGDIADFAFDRMQMTFALQWGGVWAALVTVSVVMAQFETYLPAALMFGLSTWICCVEIVGGISFLAIKKVELKGTPHWSQAWRFCLRRAVSLVLGTLTVAVGLAVCGALMFGIISYISRLDGTAGVIGGVLTLPTFFSVLIFGALTSNVYLIPIVIGVEDCSAIHAISILRQLVRQNGFALARWYARALASIIPFALATGAVTAGALGIALMLCGGEQMLMSITEGFSIAALLYGVSAAAVIAGYFALMTVFATVSFVFVYCRLTLRKTPSH